VCGIVGIASRAPVERREWLSTGRDAMTHRGPDGVGVWWSVDGRLGMGHRRLAVIDLSSAGHQPMHDETGCYTIVLNGEIYNHCDLRQELLEKGYRFLSRSDTEVILGAYREWGTDCLSHLNGMFAFALYDAQKESLFLARDRAGEKPLFYTLSDGEVRFASELKGLLADSGMPRSVEPAALDLYLGIGYVPGEMCMVQGVRKLPPAHALEFHLGTGRARVWRYWELPEQPGLAYRDGENGEALVEELEVLLEDAVRRQLVADVPVGVLLSGGVDSSLITAMAARASHQVRTFTVGFPDYESYDESGHAALIAKHFGTRHTELNAGSVQPELLRLLAHQYDEPMADSSMVPTYLVCKLVREHCTVALGGDGGDELFGGYTHHSRAISMKGLMGWVPLGLRRAIVDYMSPRVPIGFKGRGWLSTLSHDLDTDLPLIGRLFDGPARRLLVGAAIDGLWPLGAESVWSSRVPPCDDFVQRLTRMDFGNYLPEDILVKVDRASMLCSLELRSPMLDHRVVEFAFGRVPSGMKVTARRRKILLKELAGRLLPRSFDTKRKQGFSIPLGEWLRIGPWRDFFREVLLDTECWFDSAAVGELLRGQDRGRRNEGRLFALVLLELWRRDYRISM
jgi:asparagine synthase (glutamine-hydrolysing)